VLGAGGTFWTWLLRARRAEVSSQDQAGRGRGWHQAPPRQVLDLLFEERQSNACDGKGLSWPRGCGLQGEKQQMALRVSTRPGQGRHGLAPRPKGRVQ